ncbi:hypothetical protein GW17_00036011 [Ensete ventricosum]|nr:hypothetical protein GW17_00036011 [Ensete ventricosum]
MTSSLTVFTGDSISPLSTIPLPVTVGEEPRCCLCSQSVALAPPWLLVTTLLASDRPCGRPRPYAVAPIGGSPGPGDCPLWPSRPCIRPGRERSPLLAVLVACGCPCRGPGHSWMWVAAVVGGLS